MKAVVLGDVERTTDFFDRILDELWIDFDEVENPDIVFVCGVSSEVQKQLSQYAGSLICILGDTTKAHIGDLVISLSTATKQVIEMIKSAAKSKLKKAQNATVFTHNNCTLQNFQLSYPGGIIEISETEGLILGMLLETPGKVLRKETVLNTLGDRTDTSLKKLDVFIHHLRQKLEITNGAIEIETIQGVGFAIKTALGEMKESDEKLEYQGITFLRDRGQIFFEGILLNDRHLTQSEGNVFAMILHGKGKRYNQERILHQISDDIETDVEGKKIVDVYISHIRRKLGMYRELISSEFGDGYALDIPSFNRQVKVEKEKLTLYTKAPRVFTKQSFEFSDLMELLGDAQYRGNYVFYISTQSENKKTVLKIVQSSHPDKTQIFQSSGSIYTPEEKLSAREACTRFDGQMFHPEKVGQYLAFNQDNDTEMLDRCPRELNGIEDISKVLDIMTLSENVGSYIYYGRIHSNADWPRTYIAIERIPDFDTPVIVSVAVLENRVKKRIRYMSVEAVIEKYGSRRVTKIPTTPVFQNKSRELSGKTTRTECPPNLVNGVRTIGEITAAFTNPSYFGEYIYAGVLQVPKVTVGNETALNPHLVIVRRGNDLNIKIIGGVYYSGEGKIRREVKVLKLEVEDLEELAGVQIKKCIFDANMKKQFALKGIPVRRKSPEEEKTNQKVTVEIEISFTDIETAFSGSTVAPEYKNFILKNKDSVVNVVAFINTESSVRFTIQDSTGAFKIIGLPELLQIIQTGKFRIVKKELYLTNQAQHKSILELLEEYKNEVYKEGIYLVKFRSRGHPCTLVKKNGKLTFGIRGEVLTLQEFLQKYGEKVTFSVLKREK